MVDVVVMNHDPEVLEALATAVEDSGYTVAARCALGATPAELADFIREHDPRIVVYDLGPPPADSAVQKWAQLVRQPGAQRPYVITTTYPCEVKPGLCTVETVLLEPMSLYDVATAVRRLTRE